MNNAAMGYDKHFGLALSPGDDSAIIATFDGRKQAERYRDKHHKASLVLPYLRRK